MVPSSILTRTNIAKGKTGRPLVKYLFRLDGNNKCVVEVTGKSVIPGGGMGMIVPWTPIHL